MKLIILALTLTASFFAFSQVGEKAEDPKCFCATCPNHLKKCENTLVDGNRGPKNLADSAAKKLNKGQQATRR